MSEHEHHHHHEHEHEHEHHHHHEHEHEHVHGRDVDGIHIEHHIQDEACVVSGRMQLSRSYDGLRERIAEALEALAAEITAKGGIVGHVKAAAEVTQTEMFSVTDVKATVKTAPLPEITVKMAAIVFAIEPEETEALVEAALRGVRGGAEA